MPTARRHLATLLALVLASPAAAGPARDGAQRARFAQLHRETAGRVLRDHGHLVVRVWDPEVVVPAAFMEAGHQAVARLEQAFGPLEEPLEVHLGGASTSLHVAYSPAEDAVVIPSQAGVVNHGLEALDHLRHELFHAMVGRKLPALVQGDALRDEEQVAVHEGAADYFASLLDETRCFGEGLRVDPGPLRRYDTRLRWDLVVGAHARGNALTSYLVSRRLPLGELAGFFRRGALSLRQLVPAADLDRFGMGPAGPASVAIDLDGRPPSRLGRLTVPAGAVLGFVPDGRFRARHGPLEVELTDDRGRPPGGFTFEPTESSPEVVRFRVQPVPGAAPRKVIARYRAGGELVGFGVLYLKAAPTR